MPNEHEPTNETELDSMKLQSWINAIEEYFESNGDLDDINDLLEKPNAANEALDNNNRSPFALALIECLKQRNTENKKLGFKLLDHLIKNGADFSIKSKPYNSSLLHIAAHHGQADALDYLIKKIAADKTEALINHQNKDGNTALMIAVGRGNIAAAKVLLQHNKLNPDLQNKKNVSPLFLAVFKNNSDMVKLLLSSRKTNYDQKSLTGMTVAEITDKNYAECYSHIGYNLARDILPSSSPQINYLESEISGLTPLFFAAQHGYSDIVEQLIDRGAKNINHTFGLTPLHAAAHAGHYDAAMDILAKNENLSARDQRDWSAHYCAKKKGHYKIAYQISKAIYQNQLLQRKDDSHNTEFKLFGFSYKSGYSAKDKKDALNAMIDVEKGKAPLQSLDEFKKPLGQGELGKLYKEFIKAFNNELKQKKDNRPG